MIAGIEPLYQRIADAMTATLPEGWSVAEYCAIFYPDSSIYEAEYIRESDGSTRSFLPADDGDRALRQLRRAFQESGKRVWGRVWFTLNVNGTFSVRWGHDDCDANGDANFDAETEFRRHEERRLRLNRTTP